MVTGFMSRALLCLSVCWLVLLPVTTARPQQPSIEKRVSDQRLAELETLLALAVNNRRMVDMPVGFGLIDPHAIGRRKRSAHPLTDALLRELSRSPSSYNNLLQLVNPSYLGDEDLQGKILPASSGVADFGANNHVRNTMI